MPTFFTLFGFIRNFRPKRFLKMDSSNQLRPVINLSIRIHITAETLNEDCIQSRARSGLKNAGSGRAQAWKTRAWASAGLGAYVINLCLYLGSGLWAEPQIQARAGSGLGPTLP
jgi:hypothetical protein